MKNLFKLFLILSLSVNFIYSNSYKKSEYIPVLCENYITNLVNSYSESKLKRLKVSFKSKFTKSSGKVSELKYLLNTLISQINSINNILQNKKIKKSLYKVLLQKCLQKFGHEIIIKFFRKLLQADYNNSNNKRKIIEMLLDNCIDSLKQDSFNILIEVSRSEYKKYKNKLLKNKNILKINESGGDTKLMLASALGDYNRVKKLIKTENVNTKNKYGYNALTGAVLFGHTEIVNLLLANNAKLSKLNLIDAVKKDNKKIVKLLVSYGADINYKNKKGNTVLMYAVQKQNISMVKLLLSIKAVRIKANVNIKNQHGQSALMLAVNKENLEIIRLLIKNGANIGAKNWLGYTALMFAIFKNNYDIVKVLIDNGAPVNTENTYCKTALDYVYNKKIKRILEKNRAKLGRYTRYSNYIKTNNHQSYFVIGAHFATSTMSSGGDGGC